MYNSFRDNPFTIGDYATWAKHRLVQMNATRLRVENPIINELFESERRALILTLRDIGFSIESVIEPNDSDWLNPEDKC